MTQDESRQKFEEWGTRKLVCIQALGYDPSILDKPIILGKTRGAKVDEQMRADPCMIHCSESCQLGCTEPTQGVWSSEPPCVEGKK